MYTTAVIILPPPHCLGRCRRMLWVQNSFLYTWAFLPSGKELRLSHLSTRLSKTQAHLCIFSSKSNLIFPFSVLLRFTAGSLASVICLSQSLSYFHSKWMERFTNYLSRPFKILLFLSYGWCSQALICVFLAEKVDHTNASKRYNPMP